MIPEDLRLECLKLAQSLVVMEHRHRDDVIPIAARYARFVVDNKGEEDSVKTKEVS